MLELIETELENERKKVGNKNMNYRKAMEIKNSADLKIAIIKEKLEKFEAAAAKDNETVKVTAGRLKDAEEEKTYLQSQIADLLEQKTGNHLQK